VTGADVRRIRHGLQLTQAALARELGVTRVTVARWEIGVYAVPEPTARLCQRVRDEGRRAKRPRCEANRRGRAVARVIAAGPSC
jgi:DNA-binding transcriptional regulator YiaG